MKNLTILVFSVIFLFSASLVAQAQRDLEGVVTDRNGNPIQGVTVNPKGLDITVITDDKGYYKLESVPDSILTLVFTHPEKETASASIGLYNQIDVQMSDLGAEEFTEISLEELLNMEVTTVSKSAEKLSDAPGVISVISKQEMQMFGGNTLKDVLERVPGLIGSTVYMTDRSTIAPRGDQVLASSSHVLLLLNGRPVRESLEGGIKSEIYESFPVNIIERIEVIRGPGSVLYGSNAFSAVINIITEETEKSGLGLAALAGTDGAYGINGKGEIKAGDFSIMAAAQKLKKSDWTPDWSYGNFFNPGMPADTSITVQHTIPNDGTGVFMDMNFKNLRFMGGYNYWENSYFIADYATVVPVPTYGNTTWDKIFGNLGYSLNVSDNWTMDFNVTYNKSTFKTSSWPSSSRNSYEVVGEWTNFYNPTEKLGIVIGGLYNYFQGKEETPSDGVITDGNRYSLGAYAQVDYRLIKQLKLIGGLQVNKVQDIDLNLVPRAGIIWYVVDRLNVKALYSQAFRAPSINELSINFPQLQGNPDLTPEKVSTFDIGVNYQGEKSQLGLNYFYSQMKDLIYQDRSLTPANPPFYNNGVEVKIQGVEFEGKYYLTRNILFTGSVTYQESEDGTGEKNVTPIANLGIKAGLGYTSDYGLTASIFNIYQGDLVDKYKTQLNPSPGAYDIMNLYLAYNFNKIIGLSILKDLSLFVQIDNLLNQEIWMPDWGLVAGKSMPVNQGMGLYFGLKVAF